VSKPKSPPRIEVRLKGILEKTSSWARVLEDGRVELEYYDFSSAANDWFGNDVAWMYYIDPAEKPRLCQLLSAHSGAAVDGDQAMLDALAAGFGDVKLVKQWLVANQIPFTEEFDSWA
jgi:hypothetical protein